MSGSFSGFSEEDIKKLNSKHPPPEKRIHVIASQNNLKLKIQKRTTTENSNKNHETSSRTKVLNEKIKNAPAQPIVESAKLNKAPVAAPPPSLPQDLSGNSSNNIIANPENESERNENNNEVKLANRKINLEELQARQKLMEEQNRKKKEIVMKALAAKTKQTQEEAQRLNEVREEFKKLDALLSGDIKILRNQIELASLDYMDAQKKYYKIEREFLDAKLYLHQRLEKKEMLTEHLCAIIEKNEERKAEKLNELLKKLNLKSDINSNTEEKDVVMDT